MKSCCGQKQQSWAQDSLAAAGRRSSPPERCPHSGVRVEQAREASRVGHARLSRAQAAPVLNGRPGHMTLVGALRLPLGAKWLHGGMGGVKSAAMCGTLGGQGRSRGRTLPSPSMPPSPSKLSHSCEDLLAFRHWINLPFLKVHRERLTRYPSVGPARLSSSLWWEHHLQFLRSPVHLLTAAGVQSLAPHFPYKPLRGHSPLLRNPFNTCQSQSSP